MKHVVWADKESAEDSDTHFLKDCEYTLCGLAFEGVQSNPNQNFKEVRGKVTCIYCIEIVKLCKQVKTGEIDDGK